MFQWLTISLFCKKDNWARLICDGILPFTQANTAIISEYFISFNYFEGPNVRLSIKVRFEKADLASRRIDKHFKKIFFEYQQDSAESAAQSVTDIFSRPQNSIRYGMYNLPKRDYKIELTISGILESLAAKELADDDIFTAAFYLQLIILKAFSPLSTTEYLLAFYDVFVLDNKFQCLFHDFFNENNKVFHGMLEDVDSLDRNDNREMNLFNAFYNELKSKIHEKDYDWKEHHAEIFNLVNSQLGLSKYQLRMLCYCLLRLLKKTEEPDAQKPMEGFNSKHM